MTGSVGLSAGEKKNEPSSVEQSRDLLSTKFRVPPIRSNQIPRPRLIDLLNGGLDKALILVAAPAGYGKTTLVSSWLRETGIPAAWLSLDGGEDDPLHFLQYVLAALGHIVPSIEADMLGVLRGNQPGQFESVINLLINELASFPEPLVLVLDDFHLIHSEAVQQMLSYLLEHMPAQMHLTLLSRTDPPLPLARLRARNQLLDVRAEQLRFTRAEITGFLNDAMGLRLSADDLSAMEARTEGWIAGLQLAALSMQGSSDVHAFVTAFAGSHRYIMDYLVEEVLSIQPPRLRAFLLRTSILDRLYGPLCDAVAAADDGERPNGQATLNSLEQMNLFVIPLDDERRWYRYHHLFAEVLGRRLEHLFPEQLPGLHRRASEWYEQNGFIPEAIQHALASGDHDAAIRLIEQNGVLLLIRGEVSTLPGWIKAVEAHAQDRPWIHIFKAWIAALSGYPEQVEGLLQRAEGLIPGLEPADDVRMMQGTIATARAYLTNLQGETSQAARFAGQALECLPDVDLVSLSLRTVATSLLGDASSTNGELEQARQAYLEAKQIGQAAGDSHLVIVANSNLANILVELGRLHQAAELYTENLHMATRPDGHESVIAGRAYAELAQLSYEWNDLESAVRQVQRSIDLCGRWGNVDQQAIGYLMLARLEQAQDHPEGALQAMQTAARLADEHQLLPRYAVWVKCTLARLWIAQGNLEKASEIIQRAGISAENIEIPYLREPEYLVLLRLLLARGAHEPALRLSERLLQQAEAAGRTGRVIEVLVLQSLVFQGRKRPDRAMAVLKRALSLARPERYIRTFIDEGEAMTRLLCQIHSQEVESGYAAELLSAVGEVGGVAGLSMQLLIEPLTERELEVLKLIQAGHSNQEIADQLVISLPTVKRHISNIYAKLGVRSRTQAVAIGKELRLFE